MGARQDALEVAGMIGPLVIGIVAGAMGITTNRPALIRAALER